MTETKPTRGGKRSGAGRKPAVDRCTCGKHTAIQALQRRLKCRKELPEMTDDHKRSLLRQIMY